MTWRGRAGGAAGAARRRRLALFALLAGCARCGAPGIAELSYATGDVSADAAGEPVAFAPAAVGRRFVVGEAVRTGAASRAELTLAGGGTLHVEPESIVRFSLTAETPHLEVEAGASVVEAGEATPLEVETVFGVAHLEPHARARIASADGGDARFEIVVGRAVLDPASGAAALEVTVGQAVDVTGALVAGPGAPTGGPDSPPVAPGSTLAGADAAAARTVEVHGGGGSVRAPGASEFVALPEGSRVVAPGSVVRSGDGTTLDLATADGRVHVESGSEVEVTGGTLSLRTGVVRLEGGDSTRVALPGGVLVLAGEAGRSSARAEVSADGAGTVTVVRGGARHEAGDEVRTLAAPEVLALASGGAPAGEPRAAEASGAGLELPAEPGSGGAAAGTAAVTLTAGDSVVVHDPGAPTRVQIEPPVACGVGRWRFEGRAHPPDRTTASPVVLSLRPGTLRYAVRCEGGTEARGSVRVDRDAGRAVLPRTAPRTVVDTDGRTYSVLYQTLLPEIVVRWPRAPAGSAYELEVRRGGTARRVRSSSASHTFASGELVEGTHTLTFRAADGAASPPTPVRIRFDNATPVATIRAPLPGAPLGATVRVAGTAADGAAVSAGGVALEVGAAGRFEGDVPLGSGGCISIRVAVAGRGVHHHVRCAE